MSGSASSQNNLLHPECPSLPVAVKRVRDSKFYYNHNIVVLSVENILFRFQASLLAPDPDVNDYELKACLRDVLDPSRNNSNTSGASDEYPIVLPEDILVETFRDLLTLSSGGVTNNQLMRVVANIDNGIGHNPKLINHLSRLGYLAGRLGKRELDTWAQSKIQMIFQKSPSQLAREGGWDTKIILQLVQHMQITGVMHHRKQILGGMRLTLGTLVTKAYDRSDKSKDMFDYDIIRLCTELYREKSLITGAPGIFGFVFAVILSLGHCSPVWTNKLTRDDRRVLYAANSMFIRLCNHADLEVGWLVKPTDVCEVIKDCSSCSKNTRFNTWWGCGFGKCDGLNSPIPLEDVRHIVRLPNYRKLLHGASNGIFCEKKCPARLLAYIDERMELLYCASAKKYNYLKETV